MRPRMRTVRSRQARRVHRRGTGILKRSVREEWPQARGKFSLNPMREAPGCALNARSSLGRFLQETLAIVHHSK